MSSVEHPIIAAGLAGVSGRNARAENRFGVDYRRCAAALPSLPCPIIDVHAHINGEHAALIYREVARAYGIEHVFTQVRITDAPTVKRVLGDFVSFIAFPQFRTDDKRKAMTSGYLEDIQQFRDVYNAKMIKLWNAPRMYEVFPGEAGKDLIAFDSPWRVEHAKLAQQLGMGIMVHVADPDIWFATKYKDAATYGMKRDHYPPLERMIDRFTGPWLAAHMGGWPEDLDFLDGLLTRHANLCLDTSATKWVVRELSKHPRGRVFDFFGKWQGRILFGSDIVTIDDHLAPKPAEVMNKHPMADLADSPQAAFDLYASRYLALRLMFETDYDGESPIADPDLKMVNPLLAEALPAPRIRGLQFPAELLRVLYRGACEQLFGGPPVRGGSHPTSHK
jgi:hypothetical protein